MRRSKHRAVKGNIHCRVNIAPSSTSGKKELTWRRTSRDLLHQLLALLLRSSCISRKAEEMNTRISRGDEAIGAVGLAIASAHFARDY